MILFFLITTYPRAKNATYISPRYQNDIINVIGCEIILANIVAEFKQSKFYLVLADEFSCHNVKQLPVWFAFNLSTVKVVELITFLKSVQS